MRWQERLGFYITPPTPIDLWFHAVSVGESEALFPLVKKIQQRHPEQRILVTTTTPTGSARVTSTLKNSVVHVYLPYDIPFAVDRFLKHFQPKIAVVLETEIWPNLFFACRQANIPLYIINARLSEKSCNGYQKLSSLVRPTLNCIHLIATQTEDDHRRFIAIGADNNKVITVGNIKFDIEVPQSAIDHGKNLKANLFSDRFVWLIASTHSGEEIIFFDIYKELKAKIHNLLLAIAPRHPERFEEVRKLALQMKLKVIARCSGDAINSDTDFYLIDTMGELKMFYAASTIAFVGGSMVPKGGHNIIEASAVGAPVMFGPYMANFKDIASGVLNYQAAIQCQSKEEIVSAVKSLY